MADGHLPIEQMEMFKKFVGVAEWAWRAVQDWKPFARDTVGIQLVRAIDSVGANLVEGDGRLTAADGLRFLVIARASAREARYWIVRAVERKLIDNEVTENQLETLTSATKLLNTLIAYRRNRKEFTVKEDSDPYEIDLDSLSKE